MSFSNIARIISFFSNVSPKIEEFSDLHNEIEKQFLDYQTMNENDIPSSTWETVEIGGEKSYGRNVMWEYLRAKLSLYSEIGLCMCFGCFSQQCWRRNNIFMIRKNKTDFRLCLQLDGSLNSVMRIKMSVSESLTAF